MKRFKLVSVSLAVLIAVTTIATQTVFAETPLSDAQLTSVRNNCVEARATLAQLHASDALLRVNRGQLYELISTKLMAPLGSRIALNKLDGVSISAEAVAYEKQLDTFRSYYQQYEQAMSRTLTIDCSVQPAEFYAAVSDTRDKRSRVHDSTLALRAIAQQYKAEVDAFAERMGQ